MVATLTMSCGTGEIGILGGYEVSSRCLSYLDHWPVQSDQVIIKVVYEISRKFSQHLEKATVQALLLVETLLAISTKYGQLAHSH